MEKSALVYVFLTLITVFLGLFVNRKAEVNAYLKPGGRVTPVGCANRGQARNAVAEFAVFALLTGVSACRIAVGNDYWVYRFNFNLIAQERHVSYESGFNVIVKWIQNLFGYDAYLPVFAFFSFVTVLFFTLALRDQAEHYAFSLFLLMTGGYYFNSLNSVRYYLALAIALFSMKYVIRREYLKFVVIILAGTMFHKSILLVIPVYLAAGWLSRIRLKAWHLGLGALLAASLLFGQNLYREVIFFFYPYYRGSAFDNGELSFINLAKCAATLVLCAICYKKSLKGNTVYRFYFFLNAAGFLVYCCSFIPEVSRVGYYMIISQIFLLPGLIADMEEGWLKKLCYVGVIGAFTLYFGVLLHKMYAVDVRLLPYLNWIFN